MLASCRRAALVLGRDAARDAGVATDVAHIHVDDVIVLVLTAIGSEFKNNGVRRANRKAVKLFEGLAKLD